MSKIKLNDNTELNVIMINGNKIYHQNTNRDSLEFVFKKGDYDFNELDKLFADTSKTSKITIIGSEMQTNEKGEQTETPVQYIYDNYSLRVSMEMKPVVIEPATVDKAEVTEERIMVTMAQLTLIEKKLIELGMMK